MPFLPLLKSSLGRLRLLAFVEGVSYLVLLGVAVLLKYLAGEPALVRPVGMLHGGLFVAYALVLVQVAVELSWPLGTVLRAFVAAVVPFGTFWADRKLFRRGAG